MARIERQTEIARSPEDIFALLTDLDRLPEWATIVIETREVSDRPLRNGCTFRQTLKVLGREVETDWRVDELEPPRHVAYAATAPAGGTLTMRQTVAPTDGGSRVALELDYELPGGWLGELLDRRVVEQQNEREAERSLAQLKQLLED
ncbi:MAG: SRPBCC family protein [Candidatus Limnocylindria bacterium]